MFVLQDWSGGWTLHIQFLHFFIISWLLGSDGLSSFCTSVLKVSCAMHAEGNHLVLCASTSVLILLFLGGMMVPRKDLMLQFCLFFLSFVLIFF